MANKTIGPIDETLTVTCPKCGKPAGEPCREPSGAKAKKSHADRASKAAAIAQDVERGVAVRPTEAEVAEVTAATAEKADRMKRASICVVISTSRFTTRRTVKSEEVNVESAEKKDEDIDQEQITVAKELLDSPQLRAVATFDHYTKLWFKARSVPSPLLRSGAYMFAADALPEMYEYLEQRAKERMPLIQAFKDELPALKAAAKAKLGPLYDEAEYPVGPQVDRMFSFSWQVIEVSTPSDKLRGISQAIFEKEKAKADKVWTDAVSQITDALALAFGKVVDHFQKRLGGGDEPPKRFRESALKQVNDFLEAFAQRNIAGSEQLAALVTQAKTLVSGVDVKQLKDAKDGGVRKRVAEGFAQIQKSLDDMMENRPARAIARKGDEV